MRFIGAASVQVEGPRGRTFVRLLLGAAQGLAELLFEDTVAIFQGRDLAREDVLRPRLSFVETLEQGVEVFSPANRLLLAPVGQNLPGRSIDDQVGIALGAADGQLACLAHSSILAGSANVRAMSLERLPGRDEAWQLLCEYTEKEGLRKHALSVEASMRYYARLFGEDEELWGLTGLLHDFDYERWPDAENHPYRGNEILTAKGYPEVMLTAILGHAPYTGVPRETRLAKALYACDELLRLRGGRGPGQAEQVDGGRRSLVGEETPQGESVRPRRPSRGRLCRR